MRTPCGGRGREGPWWGGGGLQHTWSTCPALRNSCPRRTGGVGASGGQATRSGQSREEGRASRRESAIRSGSERGPSHSAQAGAGWAGAQAWAGGGTGVGGGGSQAWAGGVAGVGGGGGAGVGRGWRQARAGGPQAWTYRTRSSRFRSAFAEAPLSGRHLLAAGASARADWRAPSSCLSWISMCHRALLANGRRSCLRWHRGWRAGPRPPRSVHSRAPPPSLTNTQAPCLPQHRPALPLQPCSLGPGTQ